ncbi:MAG: hypothetical protein M5U05_01680 [Anaerolineales bacterium]|nr:hypothetical protein [Anaerolineales bacterium]
MPEDVMLHEAVEAIRQGQRARARDLLTRLLRADPNNVAYWLWMSSVVETAREQIYCLKSALKLEPNNPAVRQGLRLLGALPAEGEVKPTPPLEAQVEGRSPAGARVGLVWAVVGKPLRPAGGAGRCRVHRFHFDWLWRVLSGSLAAQVGSGHPNQDAGTFADLYADADRDQRDANPAHGAANPPRTVAVVGAARSHLHTHPHLRQHAAHCE